MASVASGSSATIDLGDFQRVRNSVSHNTLDRLKTTLTSLVEALRQPYPKPRPTRKADVVLAITGILDIIKYNNTYSEWTTARRIITGETGSGSSAASAYGGASGNVYLGRPPLPPMTTTTWQTPNLPPKPAPTRAPPARPTPRFKYNPFLVVERSVTDVTAGSDVRSTTERGAGSATFTVTQAERDALSAGTYQMRLYCTSSAFWSSLSSANSALCSIEFPPVLEVRVNGNIVNGGNTRGLKKKPGTAPPLDLSKLCKAGSNRVELTFMNNVSPFVQKTYYFMVNYVRYTNVDQLVATMRASRVQSADQVKQSLWLRQSDDDEIQAGAQTISLKCPLSYVRIATPCRSRQCTHGQCFDALSWYTMMEQTTTYICPVCDKTLNPEELIMDGFFNSILLNTPESVDDVVVEPNAEWHSADNKVHSSGYRPPPPKRTPAPSRQPSVRPASSQFTVRELSSTPDSSTVKASSIQRTSQIVVLDSDDDDYAPGPSTLRAGASSGQVIDLTLDSDDEQPPPRRTIPPIAPSENGKRKATSPPRGGPSGSDTTKRARLDGGYGYDGTAPSSSRGVSAFTLGSAQPSSEWERSTAGGKRTPSGSYTGSDYPLSTTSGSLPLPSTSSFVDRGGRPTPPHLQRPLPPSSPSSSSSRTITHAPPLFRSLHAVSPSGAATPTLSRSPAVPESLTTASPSSRSLSAFPPPFEPPSGFGIRSPASSSTAISPVGPPGPSSSSFSTFSPRPSTLPSGAFDDRSSESDWTRRPTSDRASSTSFHDSHPKLYSYASSSHRPSSSDLGEGSSSASTAIARAYDAYDRASYYDDDGYARSDRSRSHRPVDDPYAEDFSARWRDVRSRGYDNWDDDYGH